MLRTFKKNGERFVCDDGCGNVCAISALQYKMLSYIRMPMTAELPTSLRYDLAKYDSGAVEDAYSGLYELHEAGKLFVDDGNSDKQGEVCGKCGKCSTCEYSDVCGVKK